MGFSISWVAVQGKSKSAVVTSLGLQETGTPESVSDWPIGSAELPDGWHLLFLDDPVHALTEEDVLAPLSIGCYIVVCQVEEHVMVSAAFAFRDGEKVWDVTHDSDLGRRHLDEVGILPSQYTDIRDRLLRKQDVGDQEGHGVDYIWDIPVTLAFEIVGYRHDDIYLKDGSEVQFMELVAQ